VKLRGLGHGLSPDSLLDGNVFALDLSSAMRNNVLQTTSECIIP
jgi:hypothetical protein